MVVPEPISTYVVGIEEIERCCESVLGGIARQADHAGRHLSGAGILADKTETRFRFLKRGKRALAGTEREVLRPGAFQRRKIENQRRAVCTFRQGNAGTSAHVRKLEGPAVVVEARISHRRSRAPPEGSARLKTSDPAVAAASAAAQPATE